MKIKKFFGEWLIVNQSGKAILWSSPIILRKVKNRAIHSHFDLFIASRKWWFCNETNRFEVKIDGKSATQITRQRRILGIYWQCVQFLDSDGVPVPHWIEDQMANERAKYFLNIVCQKGG